MQGDAIATIGLPVAGNNTEVFRAAVRSVFAQSEGRWKLVILDDGASESTLRDARKIDDPRVEVRSDGARRGLATRLNEIAENCDTEYLIRMDDDDIMLPNRIARQLDVLRNHPDLDLVGSRAIAISASGGLMGLYREQALPKSEHGYLRSNAFTHPTVAGKTSWFKAFPYDSRLLRAQDKDLWLRAAPFSRFRKLDEVLLLYRLRTQFNRAKVIASVRGERAATWPHVCRLEPLAGRLAYLARSYGKQMAYELAGPIIWPRLLRARVDDALPGTLVAQVESAQRMIAAADVPGW